MVVLCLGRVSAEECGKLVLVDEAKRSNSTRLVPVLRNLTDWLRRRCEQERDLLACTAEHLEADTVVRAAEIAAWILKQTQWQVLGSACPELRGRLMFRPAPLHREQVEVRLPTTNLTALQTALSTPNETLAAFCHPPGRAPNDHGAPSRIAHWGKFVLAVASAVSTGGQGLSGCVLWLYFRRSLPKRHASTSVEPTF